MFAWGQGENGSDDIVSNGYTVLNAHTYSLCQVHKMHCSMACLTTPVKLGLFLSPFYRQKNWGLERFDYPLAVQLMRRGRPWFWLRSLLPSFLSLLFLLPSLLPSLSPSLPLSFFLIAGDFIGKSCILVLRFIALCRHIYIYIFFFLNKLKACSKPSSNKSISIIFPVAFSHFVSMSHLVFLFNIWTFSLFLYSFWWSLMLLLQKDFDSLKVQVVASIFNNKKF